MERLKNGSSATGQRGKHDSRRRIIQSGGMDGCSEGGGRGKDEDEDEEEEEEEVGDQ